MAPSPPRSPADAPSTNSSLPALQHAIAERYLERDRESGHRFLATVLVEETGELAEAARKDDLAALASEACDVAFVAFSLANLAGVDVEAAIRAKFLDRDFEEATRTWTDVPWKHSGGREGDRDADSPG